MQSRNINAIILSGDLMNIKKYISVLDIVFSLLVSFIFNIMPNYYHNDIFKFNFSIFVNTVILGIIFLGITYFLRFILIKFQKKDLVNHKLLFYSLIIFICWLPILLILYPGTFSNDTYGQLAQFSAFKFSDHHPIFDTLIMGTMIYPLAKIISNWQIAMFIYVIIQSIITSLVFGYSLVYAQNKLKIPKKIIYIFLGIYALLPIFPGCVQQINKDTIFSWIYVLFYINFIEIIRTKGENLKNKKSLILLIIISMLCCLTKKIGMYVVLLSYLILLLTRIKYKKKIIYTIGTCLIIMFGILPISFKMFNIEKGGSQEKYSLLFQQSARYIKYHHSEIDEEEKKIIETAIGKDTKTIIEVYNPILADPIKGGTQNTDTKGYLRYLLVWFKQGLRHPRTYIDATNAMLSGWLSFNEYKPLMNMNWHNQLDPNIIPKKTTERTFNKKIADDYENLYDRLYQIPIIGVLFTTGLYTCLIPIFIILTILKYNKKNSIVLVPLILSIILGCFLSPTSENIEGQRYLIPVIYTTIISVMWCIYSIKEK